MSVTTQLKVTHDERDSELVLPGWRVFEYDHEDLVDNAVYFPIEAGTHILMVAHLTTEAFDNAADLTVGDSGDADEWLTAALLTPTTLNDFVCSLGQSVDAAAGKYYSASNYLVLTFSATPTTGAGQLRVLVSGMEE